MQLLDGKKVSEDIKNEIAEVVGKMKERGEKTTKEDRQKRVWF